MKVCNYIIISIEYALVILATVYGMKWAENIVILWLWTMPLMTLPLLALVFACSFIPDQTEKQLNSLKDIGEPTFRRRFFRVMAAAEVCLLAAYGWKWTAVFLIFALFVNYFLRGFVWERFKMLKATETAA